MGNNHCLKCRFSSRVSSRNANSRNEDKNERTLHKCPHGEGYQDVSPLCTARLQYHSSLQAVRVFWDSFFTARVSLGFVWKNFLEQGVRMCVFASVFIWVCVHFISAFWIKKMFYDVLFPFYCMLITGLTKQIKCATFKEHNAVLGHWPKCDLDPAHTYSKTPPMYSPWS